MSAFLATQWLSIFSNWQVLQSQNHRPTPLGQQGLLQGKWVCVNQLEYKARIGNAFVCILQIITIEEIYGKLRALNIGMHAYCFPWSADFNKYHKLAPLLSGNICQ